MKNFKKAIVFLTVSLVTALSMAVSSGAEMIENTDFDAPVGVGSEDTDGNARIADHFTVTLTDKNYTYVGTDNNLLDEDAYFTCSALSGNIQSIDIRVFVKHENKYHYFYDVKVDDTVGPVHVRFMYGYEVWVRVNTGNVSSTNPGTVTIYWTDAD